MTKIISGVATAFIGLIGLVGTVSGEALTPVRECMVPNDSANDGLTERLQRQRYTVVTVDPSEGRLVVRSDSGHVYELACSAGTPVTIAGRPRAGLGALGFGDTVAVSRSGRVSMIRAAWEEISSPER